MDQNVGRIGDDISTPGTSKGDGQNNVQPQNLQFLTPVKVN